MNTTALPDRRVHVSHPSGEQIVRYERQGKWFIEVIHPDPASCSRTQVTIDEAVERALELTSQFGLIFWGTKGGAAFERKFKEAHRRREDS